MSKFKKGDLVTIRDEHEVARIMFPIDDNGVQWYEVEAVTLVGVPRREVRETDLHPYI